MQTCVSLGAYRQGNASNERVVLGTLIHVNGRSTERKAIAANCLANEPPPLSRLGQRCGALEQRFMRVVGRGRGMQRTLKREQAQYATGHEESAEQAED